MHNLSDPWRIHNPNLSTFTWFRKNPIKKSRLDFFLISNELLSLVENICIKPGYRTDHSIVILELRLSNFNKGKGFWKFNNALLQDKCFVGNVKKTIASVILKYAIPVYNFDKFQNIPVHDVQFTINDQQFFEQLLLEIRGMIIPFSSHRKHKQKEEELHLMKRIEHLENITNHLTSHTIFHDILDEQRIKLEVIRKEVLNGLMLRSKANWIEYGEKPTNFFCSLEKKNYINKNVKKIIDSTGNIYTEQMEILNQISNFYQNLYSTKDEGLNRVDLNYVVESNIPKLTKEESDQLEGKLTLPELGKAVRNMKNGKSPGPDGFTVEFYKFFWTDICHFLLRSLNFSFYTGELSLTQKQGIISIIPKGQKPRQYLKNWRPISLLNVSYKILTSTLSNRLKLVLNKLIHENQKGFLSGRYIGENTRLVYDILNYTEQMNKPGLLLLIDFEKAFDSISWDFLFSVIRFFNFGPDFERWIHIISRNVKLCVIQNGFFSQFFNIGRGCRQGDPISPYLFLLCVEILGMLIRKTKNIKGINISDVEYKLFQFADDMGIFLDGSENSLRNTLNLIDQFSKFSGLKPNYDKTKCIWIGSKKGSTTRLCKNIHLEWTDEPFSLFGIKFSTNLKDIAELNFTDRLNDIQNSILMWNKRNLTVLGKITVVKTILLSKLTHLLISLPSPNTG